MSAAAFFADVALKGLVLLAGATVLMPLLRGAPAAARHVLWTLALASVAALPALKLALPDWSPPGASLIAFVSPVAAAREPGVDPAPAAGGPARGDAGAEAAAPPDPAAAAASAVPATKPAEAARPEGTADRPAHSAREPAVHEGPSAAARGAESDPGPSAGDAPRVSADGASAGGPPPWSVLVIALWAAGALVVLARHALSLRSIRRIARACVPIESGPIRAEADRLARAAGVSAPRLIKGPADLMPMAWGVLRPTVALPDAVDEWHPRRVGAVLRHEIAHLRRRDPLAQWIADIVCALHWFDPFAWYAAARLRAERELACDDEVISGATRPSDYAADLVGVARTMRALSAGPALSMARASLLSARVQAVLEAGRRRAPVRRAWVVLGACAAGLLVAPLAAATPRGAVARDAAAATTASDPAPERPGWEDEVAADVEPGAELQDGGALEWGSEPRPAAAVAEARAGAPGSDVACWEGDWKGSRMHNVNDGRQRFTWESGDCELDLRLEGDVRFTRAMDGIESMGRDARFQLREDDGGTRRELEAAPARDGRPVYTYRVNGAGRPFDDGARRWFARIVLQLARNTGLGAEQRVAALLRQGGPDAVLAEMVTLGGDGVRALYFRELADQAQLDPAQVEAGLRLATRLLDSDHYLAEVAGTLAGEGPLGPGARDALVGAIGSMDSDHYKAEVTTRALDGGALGPRTLSTLLEAAQRVDSDHYRASILVDAASRYVLDATERDAYVRLARSMDSDHYRAEVLNALLERGGEGVAESVTLAAADAMESDHYMADVIEHAAAGGLRGSGAQRAFVRAVSANGSDHYRAEMLLALLEAGGDDPEQVATVVVAARAIDSDHYLAEVLTAVAGRARVEGPLRDAFEQTMQGIESETYYGKVSRLLSRDGG